MGRKMCALLTAAAAVATVTAAATGCGAKPDEGQKGREEKERTKISIAAWNAEEAFRGDEVLDAIEERFGVEIVPVNMTGDDHYQKIERWAATGSLPDLFVGDFRNSSYYIKWIQEGLISAIPEDLSAYPHLESYMEGLKQTQMTPVDGRYYCIPKQSYPSQAWTSIDRVIAYRWDLAQRAGIEREPETWEEFQEMILAIIRENPEGKGILGTTSGDATFFSGILLPYASSIAVSDGNGFFWKLDEDGVYRPVYFAEDLTDAFQLGRDMYQSGVIERDVLLQTSSSAQEKFLRGENAAILYSGGYGGLYRNMSVYWEEYHDGHDYTEDVKALKLMPDKNGNKAYPVWGYAWSESYISAKAGEEKLDKILQIYDYLLSDEGAFFASYGPEGDLYTMVDGKVRMRDDGISVAEKYPSCSILSNLVRWFPDTYDDRFTVDIPESYGLVNRELMREAETVPIPEYEPECSNIVKEEQLDFTIHIGNDFLRIMTGAEPVEEMWEEIKGEYEEKGLQEVIDRVNAAMRERQSP